MARGPIGNMKGMEVILAQNKKQLSTWSDEEKIRDYLTNPDSKVKISEALQHKIDRLYFTAGLIKKHRSFRKVQKVLTEKPWDKFGTISATTAWRDFKEAQRLFGSLANHDQAFHVDLLMEDLQKDIKRAQADGDHRAVAALRKQQVHLIDEHMGGHESDLYKNLQPAPIVIGSFPEELKTELPPEDELKARIERLMKPKQGRSFEADDVEYEDVDD